MADGVDSEKLEVIKSLFKARTEMVVNDRWTFVWVKSKEQYQEYKNNNLGGGNFTVALSLFSLLNFYSKVYAILRKPSKYPKEEMVEEAYFAKLIVATKFWDYKDGEELKCIWSNFRNHLAHMGFPDGVIWFQDYQNYSFEDIKKRLRANASKPWFYELTPFVCQIDSLLPAVENISEWLIKQISECTDNLAINNLYQWLTTEVYQKYSKYKK